MILDINIKNKENIGEITEDTKKKIKEIVEALIVSGGLTGVKGGSTIIHFNGQGIFQGIQLSYWPWRRKK